MSHVQNHYNNRTYRTIQQRNKTELHLVFQINNFIKTLLIQQYLDLTTQSCVLDLCCGKGGDLMKYKHQKVQYYYGYDIAEKSIEEAEMRYLSIIHNDRFLVSLWVLDCYLAPLPRPFKLYDLVSIQFALHYAFASESQLNGLVQNMTQYTAKNGYIIMTVPNQEAILHFHSRQEKENYNNPYCKIVLNTTSSTPSVYNKKYMFYLKDAVDQCEEYLVDVPTLVEKLSTVHFAMIKRIGFTSFFNQQQLKHQDLLKKMIPVLHQQASPNIMNLLDQYMWDIIDLYEILVFSSCSII